MKTMKKLLILACVMTVSTLWAGEKKMSVNDLVASKSVKVIEETAAWAGKEKEKDAIPNLIKLLSDKRVMVRLAAVKALGYIGEEEYLDKLHNILLNDGNATVRYAALLATIKIGSEKSIPVWKRARMNETDPFTLDILKKMEAKSKDK